ncbi:VCBS domain-containing protein [Bradyrhizobium sediminis]|uniref:VCBS domain-containing protein n=1 Tax=Bradyrhizobium sediminis TaxID=2840469 RepID=A0A975NLG0_9BRAD|nr:VCBS domain-containing protein [Bradyrhizobium sediminis]QWG17272.1 VCBS domain-containing protein [Bradyrhizobium sediminis]
MFVASRLKSRAEGEALVALLPQVIGNIQTAVGCGTLRRAGGIAVQVMAGDPVCQGDVIETAAGGRIGIRFVDGTVFNLSSSTRVVLNEFICDSTGTSHSALFGVTRGAFAFIAGQLAKTGCLKVDTPFGSIRGRAHTGGIGMLSLTALIFSAMKEARAADPNVTFLDDDIITYKDLEHGTFELVTKEAIPRHFFVEDPGATIVLRPQGSTIGVNQVTNTATRMAELQAAQQEALATFAKGPGSTGSSTPPFVNPLPLQPINFIQTDGSSPAQNSLPPLPWIFASVPEIIFGRLPPPPPTLNAVTGPIEIDTAAFDVFAATSGTFVASSPNSDTLIYGVSGGTAGSTVLGGVTYDVSNTGPYGTLYVNSSTGAYIFVPDSGAINALAAPTTTSFIVTVSDGTLSADQTFTIAINGTNDAAIISGTATGSAIEAGGAANATSGTPTATGTLTDFDVDNAPDTFTAVSSPAASAGGYGTFTMTAAGVWTYTLNEANSAVQALNAGDTLTDSFTVTTVDGTAQVVLITIKGSNDAAIISGTTAGSVIEAGDATCGTTTATGTLTDTDVDNTANTFAAVTSPRASADGYGTFTMTPAGVWTYTLDDANCAVQALNIGDTLTDSFTVTTVDGTAQVVAITINGSNDAAIISGTTTGSVIEAGGATCGSPTATGTLTDTDVDNTPNTFTAVTSPRTSAGGYGTFTMTTAGLWIYTLDDANSAVQALDVCDTLTDTFTVTTVDGTAQVVTITINGSSDADPNDFDSLATGKEVISDPPYVYGTRGGETIAGGGNDGQIIYAGAGHDTINGTGKSDLLYGGSGNDTMKGNDGDDTIYGGSGSDTINGNNGCDIIVGGYGADNLTGSNGDDRFVYLSVADSNAARFDTISDFKSGSDRIDLTALGGLAFAVLALTSTSTSVPAHTIAWLYDSMSNQTIVYVNPTDQTLSIGNSALLEIHLQGIVSVELSDFVFVAPMASAEITGDPINLELAVTAENDGAVVAMTSADIPSDWTVNDGALLADQSWSLQTTDVSYGFDADQDPVGLIGHARFTGFAEARVHAAEDASGNATITPANGRSIVLEHVHVTATTENDFAFDHAPLFDIAGPTTIADAAELHRNAHGMASDGNGWIAQLHHTWNSHSGTHSVVTSNNEGHTNFQVDHLSDDGLIPTNGHAIHATNTHVHTIDTGSDVLHSPAGLGASGNHGLTLASSIANSAVAWAGDRNDDASGHGAAVTHGSGAPDFGAPSTADVVIGARAAGTLGLGDSFHFNDGISGLDGSAPVDLAEVDLAAASINHREDAAETGGHHAASDGAQAIEAHSADHFNLFPGRAASDGATHAMHDLMV